MLDNEICVGSIVKIMTMNKIGIVTYATTSWFVVYANLEKETSIVVTSKFQIQKVC